MKDKGPLWESIVRKYGLAPHPYDALAYWPAADFVLNCGYDVMTSTVKARKAGIPWGRRHLGDVRTHVHWIPPPAPDPLTVGRPWPHDE